MEGILLRILWVFGRGMSYWPVYRGWPVYRWPVWKVSLYQVFNFACTNFPKNVDFAIKNKNKIIFQIY